MNESPQLAPAATSRPTLSTPKAAAAAVVCAVLLGGCAEDQGQAAYDPDVQAAMMRAAGAMLAPTQTGTFGESLGNAFGAAAGWPPPNAWPGPVP